MIHSPPWQEVESKVHRPGMWLPFLVSTSFVLAGTAFFVITENAAPPGAAAFFAELLAAVVFLVGCASLAWFVGEMGSSAYVRHAVADVLPGVPAEPVIWEGAVVEGRLTRELREAGPVWELQPMQGGQGVNKRLLLEFGVFMVSFSTLPTWTIYYRLNIAGAAGWGLAAVCGSLLSALCYVLVLLSIGVFAGSRYSGLSKLTIPLNGDDVELELAEARQSKIRDLVRGLGWKFVGVEKRQLIVPRDFIVAVQLCPWKYIRAISDGQSITWAVQGSLVLASDGNVPYQRLPLFLTNDFVGAARMMQTLAHVLAVPYIFCADAAGWRAERVRAAIRPPLRMD